LFQIIGPSAAICATRAAQPRVVAVLRGRPLRHNECRFASEESAGFASHPERCGACLRQQRNARFDALLFKKHRQLYAWITDLSAATSRAAERSPE